MSNTEEITFTQKRNTDALEGSSEVIVGLQRMADSDIAKIAASNLSGLRELLLHAGAVAGADQSAEIDSSSTAKAIKSKIESFNRMATLYGVITGSAALTSIKTDGEAVDVAEQMIVPALESLHEPVGKAFASLGEALVKECRSAQKSRSKAQAHAAVSNEKWSALYHQVVERVREARALQTVNGLEVPKAKRKPGAGRPKDDSAEPEPVEPDEPAVEPVTFGPTPAPAPGPVNPAEPADDANKVG